MTHQEMESVVKGEQRNGRGVWSQGKVFKWMLSGYVCVPVRGSRGAGGRGNKG